MPPDFNPVEGCPLDPHPPLNREFLRLDGEAEFILHAEEVQLALAELRAEYRQAFLLFHDHEMSYGEIAEAMGVPLGTIKTWVHRARRELIDLLSQRGAIPDQRHAMHRV